MLKEIPADLLKLLCERANTILPSDRSRVVRRKHEKNVVDVDRDSSSKSKWRSQGR